MIQNGFRSKHKMCWPSNVKQSDFPDERDYLPQSCQLSITSFDLPGVLYLGYGL